MRSLFKNHYTIAFFVTLAVALGLIIASMFIPPKGKVDPSVLTAVGEIFLWPALAMGAKALDDGKKARLQKGDMTLTIGDTDDDNDEKDDCYGRSEEDDTLREGMGRGIC